MANTTPGTSALTAIVNDTESLARELRKPIIQEVNGRPLFLIPEDGGYKAELHEELLERPPRKRGDVYFDDTDSFIRFVKREGSLASCNIYVQADYQKGVVKFTAVLNDHEEETPHWRDYRAIYVPDNSPEWCTWTGFNKKVMTQADFAVFLEDNNKDIASVAGLPTGAEVLAMALTFESKQEIVIKSAQRTQSGTVAFTYSNLEDGGTTERMEMFKGFAIGITPFFNGQGFQLNARLKYRTEQQRLKFWYELDRPDLALQEAAAAMIATIKSDAGFPMFLGHP